MTAALRAAVIATYPDPLHLYRLNIKDIRTHSIRVYACLALIAVGLKDHEMEHKLRWASKAWMVYVRENLSTVSTQTATVFHAAFVTESLPETTVPLLLDEDMNDGN